jgi:hypothetical protein
MKTMKNSSVQADLRQAGRLNDTQLRQLENAESAKICSRLEADIPATITGILRFAAVPFTAHMSLAWLFMKSRNSDGPGIAVKGIA